MSTRVSSPPRRRGRAKTEAMPEAVPGLRSGSARDGESWRPAHRITVFIVILIVVVALQITGNQPLDTVSVVLMAGSAAAQISSWLGGGRVGGRPGGPGGL